MVKLISAKKNPKGKSLLWSIDKVNEWELHFLTTIDYRLVLMDTLNLERDCKKYLQNDEELVQKGLPIIYSFSLVYVVNIYLIEVYFDM